MKKAPKTKVNPWSDAALPYKHRANWSAIADAMFEADVPAPPKSWSLDDIETRCFMETAYEFDTSLSPLLWKYLHDRLEVLVLLRAETVKAAVAPTKVEKLAAAACGEARP
jgi:hypothetical protein